MRVTIARHVRSTVRLAAPIVLARLGWMFMSFVDIVMVGRYSTSELAYMSLATSLMSVAYVTMMGMMLGTLVVASNLFGERRYSAIGAVWRRSVPYAIGLGVLIVILSLVAESLLLLFGQQPALASEAAKLIRIYAYGMPLGGLLYVTSQYFLEGIKRPRPAMILMLFGNVLNAALNWVLIYGHCGVDAMGAAGSAWATSVVRTLITAGLIYYIWTMPGARIMGVRRRYKGGFQAWKEQRRLGYAAGLSFGIEHVSFVMLFMFAGLLGTLHLAAVTIIFNTFALFFMAASGIAGATAVQVGIAYGRRNGRDIALAGWIGWSLMAGTLVVPALAMVVQPGLFARIYTDDPALIALAAPLYVLGGLALVFDASQMLWSNALRSRHDKWFPTFVHVFAYLMLMVPLAWYFAFELEHRSEGLFEALLICSGIAVALLTWRFVELSRRDRRAPGGLLAARGQHCVPAAEE